MEWFSVLLLGFFLGMKHATDADHVVAVTTIVSQQNKVFSASVIGLAWGMGHTLTILMVGSALVYFDLVISPHLGLSMEFSVGVMIVILGLFSLRGFLGTKVDQERHGRQFHLKQDATWFRFFRPFAVGLVHGMAGSAAVALLVLNALSDKNMAFLYLLIFGFGTIVGMMLVTILLGLPYVFSKGFGSIHRILGIGTALFSIGFGLMLMYQLGVTGGLFTEHPQWTPE